MILAVLLHGGSSEAKRHHEKEQTCDLKPEHVSGASERAGRRGDRAQRRGCSAAAGRLIARYIRGKAEFSQGRNFAHTLDFNSLAELQ